MEYISTRGKSGISNFENVLLAGLAKDGGLYICDNYPKISIETQLKWQTLDYPSLAYEILSLYMGDSIPEADLKKIIFETYNENNFNHSAIAPLKQVDHKYFILELFHGPTLAFKDYALQLFGRLLDYTLNKKNEKAIILGATSGDTGSAAIYGCNMCKNAKVFILHPHNKTSEIQRKQMTTVDSENVHNIAIKGNFDDCQEIVKNIFMRQDFLKKKHSLISVNSINWARISAQIVYYFYSALRLGGPYRKVSFSVPTGNFGDIFAGYIAMQMGLPIEKLIIATNANDILKRFIFKNEYKRETIQATLSPSMDIQIASNFERLLFDAHKRDAEKISTMMDDFKEKRTLSVDTDILDKIRTIFTSESCSDEETVRIMKDIYEKTGEIIDPHTATAIKAASLYEDHTDNPIVSLATAHPAKFCEALKRAGLKLPEMPKNIEAILHKEEKYTVLENDTEQVIDFIRANSFQNDQ